MKLTLTAHSIKRVSQRGFSDLDIAFVLRYGRKVHNAGAVFYFLGRRDIPEELKAMDYIAKLEGTTILVSQDGSLITVYRNKLALKDIKKKSKRYIK